MKNSLEYANNKIQNKSYLNNESLKKLRFKKHYKQNINQDQ